MRRALDPSWSVKEASDGLEALDVARAGGIDVVIAEEIVVPYGAFGLTRDLKILADPPRVVVLLERAQDTWLARWSGADVWLLQPVDPVGLRAAIAQSPTAEHPPPPTTAEPNVDEPLRAHAVPGSPHTEA